VLGADIVLAGSQLCLLDENLRMRGADTVLDGSQLPLPSDIPTLFKPFNLRDLVQEVRSLLAARETKICHGLLRGRRPLIRSDTPDDQ
jgi:hypothetical protein